MANTISPVPCAGTNGCAEEFGCDLAGHPAATRQEDDVRRYRERRRPNLLRQPGFAQGLEVVVEIGLASVV